MTLVLPKINSEVEPSKRNGHLSVLYQGCLVVYGGHKTDEFVSDDEYIWFYKVDTSYWIKYKTTGKQVGFFWKLLQNVSHEESIFLIVWK